MTSTSTRNSEWRRLPGQRSTAVVWYRAKAPVCHRRAPCTRSFRRVGGGAGLAKDGRMNTFKADIEEIRRRARQKMEDGAVTASYKADKTKVVEVLNEVLATEVVCTLRYKTRYYMAQGIHSESVAAAFLQHA